MPLIRDGLERAGKKEKREKSVRGRKTRERYDWRIFEIEVIEVYKSCQSGTKEYKVLWQIRIFEVWCL